MEVKRNLKKQKKNLKKKKENLVKDKKVLICAVSVIILLLILIPEFKERKVEIKIKSTLDKIVEKADLETVTFTYNVIAKECKDKEKCDKTSNKIKDFKYVVSCKGSVTAGIDFDKVKDNVEVDVKNKKIIVKVPEAKVTDYHVSDTNYLNGDKIPAKELPNAMDLCENTIKEKSKEDENLLLTAKDQAGVALQSFYEKWIKAFDEEYIVEVK